MACLDKVYLLCCIITLCLCNQHQHRHYPDDQPDDAGLLRRDLRVLDQLGQVLLADPVLRLDVEQDDPEQCFF